MLSLPVALGPSFAGNAAIGAGVLLAFWLYLCHIVALIGYAAARRLSGPIPTRPQPAGQARQFMIDDH